MSEVCKGAAPAEVYEGPRDECGVFAVYAPSGRSVAQIAYLGLHNVQHRGQSAAGIAINNGRGFTVIKGEGLVDDVFPTGARELDEMNPGASIAVGHARYGTSQAKDNFLGAQPLLGPKTDVALAHNGNLPLIELVTMRYGLTRHDYGTDSEGGSLVLDIETAKTGSLVEGMKATLPQLTGAFSLAVSDGKRLIAARDPNGFRPLSIGMLPDGGYVVASETPAIKVVGAEFVRDVNEGEMVIIDENGLESIPFAGKPTPRMCAFEFVYTARPDSKISDRNVHLARERAGKTLARNDSVDADMVVAVPESGMSAALGYAKESGIPLELGITKSRYVARTFIDGTSGSRETNVRNKFHANEEVISGKKLVIVDDSIIRGTTMRTLVTMLRSAGAKEIHLRIPSPPYRWPCYYGMDTGRPDELLARKYPKVEQMREYIEVESLAFLSVEGLEEAIALPLGQLCTACADGRYPTPVPLPDNLRQRLLPITPV